MYLTQNREQILLVCLINTWRIVRKSSERTIPASWPRYESGDDLFSLPFYHFK